MGFILGVQFIADCFKYDAKPYLRIFEGAIMKTIKAIIVLTLVSIFTTTTYAAEVPRESAPCNATNEAIVIVESFIGDILTEVQNGLGRCKSKIKSYILRCLS